MNEDKGFKMEEIIVEKSFTHNDGLDGYVYSINVAENKNKEKYFKVYIGIPEKRYLLLKQINNELKTEEIQKLGSNFSLVKNDMNLFKNYEEENKEKINNNLICFDTKSFYTFKGDLTEENEKFVSPFFKEAFNKFRIYIYEKNNITNTKINQIKTDEVIKTIKELEKETMNNNLSPKELSQKVVFY